MVRRLTLTALLISLLLAWGRATEPPTALALPAARFAVIGDFGLAGSGAGLVAALVAGWNPDFIVTTGDNNYPHGGADTIDSNVGQYYHGFIAPYVGAFGAGASTNRFFPAMGNHDWETGDGAPYLSYFAPPGNGRYYSVATGGIDLFLLDSDPHEPDGVSSSSTQATWLRQALAGSGACSKVVAMHHPPYSSGPHGPTAWMQWPFQQWGATAVFAGHDHLYERLQVGEIPYFVNGLGGSTIYGVVAPVAGSQVRYSGSFGAMLVESDASVITFRFFAANGTLVDSYVQERPCLTTTRRSAGGTAGPTALPSARTSTGGSGAGGGPRRRD